MLIVKSNFFTTEHTEARSAVSSMDISEGASKPRFVNFISAERAKSAFRDAEDAERKIRASRKIIFLRVH